MGGIEVGFRNGALNFGFMTLNFSLASWRTLTTPVNSLAGSHIQHCSFNLAFCALNSLPLTALRGITNSRRPLGAGCGGPHRY